MTRERLGGNVGEKSATAFFDFVLAVFPGGRSQSPFFLTKIIDFTDKLLRNCNRVSCFVRAFIFFKNRILLSKLTPFFPYSFFY